MSGLASKKINSYPLLTRFPKAFAFCAWLLIVPISATSPAAFSDPPKNTEENIRSFDIPAQPLSKALMTFGLQCGCAIVVPSEQLKDATSSPVIGKMSKYQALSKLLRRSQFDYKLNKNRIVIVERSKDKNDYANTQKTETSEAQVPTLDELLIVGIRQSLSNALQIKKHATGVVDAISAEDIGKFPDSNLAESVQRIPGASISRVNGEGSKVTVRGFTGNYNQVTYNGRVLPVITTPVDKIGDSRAFDFSNLAAENIKSLTIYKTHHADLATGGIGATIDIQSYKALDAQTSNNYISVKGLTDQSQFDKQSITPEISGMLNWNLQNQLAFSISGSWQERKSGRARAYVDQWNTNKWQALDQAGAINTHSIDCASNSLNPLTDRCITLVNAPQVGDLYSLPSGLHYALVDTERERSNLLSSLQYQPHEHFTLSLDYALFDNKIQDQASEMLLRLTNYRSFLEFDDRSVKTPIISYETIYNDSGQASASDLGFAAQRQNLQNKTTSAGFNLNYDNQNNLTLNLDIHSATSRSGPYKDNYGTWANVRFGANVVGAQQVDWSGELPITTITIDDRLLAPHNTDNGEFNAADIGTQVAFNSFSYQENNIDQLQLAADWQSRVGDFNFGVDVIRRENRTRFSEIFYIMGDWGISDPSQVPDNLFSPLNIRAGFDDYKSSNLFNNAYSAQPEAVLNWAFTQYPERFSQGFRPNPDLAVDRSVEEKTQAAFIKYDRDLELLNKPFYVSLGLRYTTTDATASAWVNKPSDIIWYDNGDFDVSYNQNKSLASQKNNYDFLLPSVHLKWHLHDDIVARFSHNQSLARADYAELSPEVSNINVIGINRSGQNHAFAETGNPQLSPLKSNNLDITLEWYFADTSYISIALYDKRINNFIGSETRNQGLYGLRDASAGPRAQDARSEIENSPNFDGVVTDTELFNQIAATENNDFNPPIESNTYYGDTYDIEPNANDPEYTFAVLTPVNNKNARIWGTELAAQYFFGQSGFGVLANYTTVNGDISYDILADLNTPQFALLGLSDTFNLVAIYEKGRWQARLAHNWRDNYLDSLDEEPVFVEAYSQLDFSATYKLSKQLSISFEGINITEENSRSHGRTTVQLINLEQLSARYLLGLRYQF